MDKKGDAKYYVVISIVLALFFLLGFSPFIAKLFSEGTDIQDKLACKASVEAESRRFEFKGQVLYDPDTGLNCPTKEVTVEKRKDVLETVAVHMFDCWDKFLEGRKNFFPIEDGTYCVVCSEISFVDEASENHVFGFLDYLDKTRIPNRRETYLEFFNGGYETDYGLIDELEQDQKDFIDTSEEHSVVFISHVDKKTSKPMAALIGAATGGGLLGIGTTVASLVVSGGWGIVLKLAKPVAFYLGVLGGAKSAWGFGSENSEYASMVLAAPKEGLVGLNCIKLRDKDELLE